jgi:hypothetical protein
MYVYISLFFVGRGQQRADSLTNNSYEMSKGSSVSEVNSEFRHARWPNV